MRLIKTNALLLMSILIVFLQIQCQADPARDRLRNEAKEVLSIKPSSSMTKADAEKIIQFYFQNNISGCGFASELADEGDYWSAFPRIGVTGAQDKVAIRLHKQTGRISWGSGPSFPSTQAMVSMALKPTWLRALSKP